MDYFQANIQWARGTFYVIYWLMPLSVLMSQNFTGCIELNIGRTLYWQSHTRRYADNIPGDGLSERIPNYIHYNLKETGHTTCSSFPLRGVLLNCNHQELQSRFVGLGMGPFKCFLRMLSGDPLSRLFCLLFSIVQSLTYHPLACAFLMSMVLLFLCTFGDSFEECRGT